VNPLDTNPLSSATHIARPPDGASCLISVVAPCRDEAESIAEFHRRTTLACAGITDSYEIVLVDDGSTDETWALLTALAHADPQTVAIKLSRNHGHQLALAAGLQVCRGERVLIIDADLQDPPELLPDMMQIMDHGADVVFGRRRTRRGEDPLKKSTAKVFYRLLIWLTDVPIPADCGDFRLISRRVLNVLLQMPERHRFFRGMVSWIGFQQQAIDYDRDPRRSGVTKYNYRRMFRFAFDAITGFSIRPLQLASFAGVVFAFGALGVLGYTLISWMFFQTVPGWTSVLAVIALLGSVQLLVLGIIGEYLGRLYVESQRRPLVIIEEIRTHPHKTIAK
jgi:glycosyltransferase involved in cell wall biosynthesis